MASNKTLNIMIVMLIILIILSVYPITIAIYSLTSHKLPFQYATPTHIDFEYKKISYTHKQVREYIEQIVGKLPYFYREKDILISKNRYGETNLILRVVTIHNNLDIYNYIFSFAHEYLHLKYMTASERFVNLKTFELLYNSGNNDFRNVAIWYANRDMIGIIPHDYQCWAYIKTKQSLSKAWS